MRLSAKDCAAGYLTLALLGANGPAPIAATIDGRAMVAVAPLAAQLGIPLKRLRAGVALEVDGTWVELHPDDITLHEGDAPVLRLTSFPIVRYGRLFINAADVPAVFDTDASIHAGRVFAAKNRAAVVSSPVSQFSVREVAAPRPSAVPSAAPVLGSRMRKIRIGDISASVFSYAQQTNYNALLDGGGAHFHATMYVNGMAGSHAAVGGTVRIGDAGRRHVSLGGVNDPLYGGVFTGGGANGIELADPDGAFLSYSRTAIGSRDVLAVGERSGQWQRVAALAGDGGAIVPLFGLQHVDETPGGTFDQELWTGLHGFAAALRYRTTGRLYADTRVAIAGAGLPLVQGDAPAQATIGYDLSSLFGVRAGYGIARSQHGEAVVQLYGGPPGANFTLSHYGNENSASVAFARRSGRLQLQYLQAPGYRGVQGDGTFEAPHGAIETRAYFASDSSDVAVAYRFKRTAPSLSIGVESVRAQTGGRIAPTLGYVLPVTGALSLGVEYHPLANGSGLRFTAAQSLYVQPASARRSVSVALESPSQTPVYVLVDGVRVQQLVNRTTRISVESGSHYLSVQTEDGRFGSPEDRIIDGAPAAVSLPLWPIVELKGAVQTGDIPLGMARPALGGITVLLEPSGVATQTEPDGTFVFPAQALDPQTHVEIDAATVPNGYAAAQPSAIEAGQSVTILLHPTTKIEKVVF